MPEIDTTPKEWATLSARFQRQVWVIPPAVEQGEGDLSGKTTIVTEADTALGLECARQLCDLGISRLILAVRDEDSGLLARDELLSAFQYHHEPERTPAPAPPSFRERIASGQSVHDCDDYPPRLPLPRASPSPSPSPSPCLESIAHAQDEDGDGKWPPFKHAWLTKLNPHGTGIEVCQLGFARYQSITDLCRLRTGPGPARHLHQQSRLGQEGI